MLSVKNLKVSFGNKIVVKDFSFELSEGESLGIIGESGSGKTTAIQAITGLCAGKSEGQIHFEGNLGKEIGMVFQSHMCLNPTMKIDAQIAEGMIYHKFPNPKQRASELLHLVGIPHTAKSYPHELSGGQRQRAAIAIALACNPRLLIADEPTSALDAITRNQILALIQELQQKLKMSLILISHDLHMVKEICDKVIVMYQGQIVEQGNTRSILEKPLHPYTQMLLKSRIKQKSLSSILCPEPIMTVNNVSKSFSHIKAVDNVTFNIYKGETLALIGESGCGKSTLGRMLLGAQKPDHGQILFEGKNLPSFRKIQMVFQNPDSTLNPKMSIEEILSEPTQIHGTPNRVDELLKLVALPLDAKKRFPHQFSGGQKQRIGIARALALNPTLLLCDEPVSSLDVSIQAQMIELLLRLKKELQLTLLFISHDLPLVRHIADRIAVMKKGHLVEIKESESLFQKPEHDYTKTLLNYFPK